MEIVGTMRFTPTVFATGIRFAIRTIVIPALSISRVIVAPQRVHVPQVEVMIAAVTPSASNSAAISRPILAASACVVPVPTVE